MEKFSKMLVLISVFFLVGCVADCKTAKHDLDSFIDAHSSCSADSDCTPLIAYPAAVNVEHYDEARAYMKTYGKVCGDDAGAGIARCVDNVCTIVKPSSQ